MGSANPTWQTGGTVAAIGSGSGTAGDVQNPGPAGNSLDRRFKQAKVYVTIQNMMKGHFK